MGTTATPHDPGHPAGTPRVLLIGMMGAGKTTLGRELSARTGWPYLDNDELVARSCGRPTAAVLAAGDEATLRRAEADALDAALAAPAPVVAGVAAGVVVDPAARRRLVDGGFVVFLRAPLDVLARRVGGGDGRPWLDADPRAALARLQEGRMPLYREVADLVLDVDGVPPAELADTVLDALVRRGAGAPSAVGRRTPSPRQR